MKNLLYIPFIKTTAILSVLWCALFLTNTSCNTATCPHTPEGITPIINGAIQLDGVNDYVDLQFAPSIYDLQVGTVSFWVKIENLTDAITLFSVAQTGPTGFSASSWAVSYRGDLTSQKQIQMTGVKGNTGGATSDPYTSANSIPDNDWHNVTIVSNNNSDNVEIYVDGTLKTITAGACCGGDTKDFFFADATNIDNAKIGVILRNTFLGYGKFSMDDFCIWNRALSLSEVQALAANPLNAPASGLLVHYTFDKFEDLGQGFSGVNDIKDKAGSNHADAVNGVLIAEH
ncbi:MAG: hypothetical protein JWM14_1025 [Chitinophagaceae bacterium]|nr:hypothetical protein [Chitinophagaceae bacterium]